jgi:hypothetical protein
MQYEDTNTGAIFRNERKTTDKQPDYRGTLDVNGEKFWVAGWIKTAGPLARTPGQKFLSLALTKQEEIHSKPASTATDFDDDIPF